MADIMEALGETLKIDRPSMATVVGVALSRYVKSGAVEHGEYVFRFDNGRGAVLLIDSPHEQYKFVILEVYWTDEGKMCMVERPDSTYPYVLHTSIHEDDAPAILRWLKSQDPHPYVGPAVYETSGGERLVLTRYGYTNTQGRIDGCRNLKIPYTNVRITEWFMK